MCSNFKTVVRSVDDIKFCTIGSATSDKIMFWGDSHVQQLYPLISKFHEVGTLGDHSVLIAVANGCLPAEHLNRTEKGFHCDAFAHFAMQRAEQGDISTVFVAFNTWWSAQSGNPFVCPSVDGQCTRLVSAGETGQLFLQDFGDTVRTLRMRSKRVIVSLPFPMYDKSIPDSQIRNAVLGRFGVVATAQDITLPALRQRLFDIASDAGADVFDPRKSLCDEHGCMTQRDGISIYKDDNHIAASQLGLIESNLRAAVR